MNEWGVVGVIIALFGFGVAVVKPILNLNTIMTKLVCAVDELIKSMDKLEDSNSASHKRLWEKNNEQDTIIAEHEGRIKNVEGRIR